MDYMKPLSPEDLDVKREELAEACIKANDIAEEAKQVAAAFKNQLKPIHQTMMDRLLEIKMKQEIKHGKVYHCPNFDTRMMEDYDETGELISTRRLRPDERQASLFVQAPR
jgi:hypothetical protein